MFRQLLFLFFYLSVTTVSAADRTILVLGDSLSAGYQMSVEQGWVALLETRLQDEGYDYNVVNASISGDTTSGALARLDSHIRDSQPDIAIIELGGNDGLRGLPLDEMYKNLSAIIARLHDAETKVLLLPIQIPPNYGQIYTTKFAEVYQQLAETHDVVLGRFLLESIALNPELMMSDGIHPTAKAQPMVLDNVWRDLQPVLDNLVINTES